MPLEWPEAECNCAGDGGILAIIDSKEKQEYFEGNYSIFRSVYGELNDIITLIFNNNIIHNYDII